MTYADVVTMKEFGVVTRNVCEFELDLLKTNNKDTLPTDANAFFELYIMDSEERLIDVPVRITNYTPARKETSPLVHRFFIYDTISGIRE